LEGSAQQIQRKNLIKQGAKALAGQGALETEAFFARIEAFLAQLSATAMIDFPGATKGLSGFAEVTGKLGGKLGIATDAAIAVQAFANAVSAVKAAGLLSGAAEAPGILSRLGRWLTPSAALVTTAEVAGGGLTAGTVGTGAAIAALSAGAAYSGYKGYEAMKTPLREGSELTGFVGSLPVWTLPPPGNVDARTSIDIIHTPTINISIPPGASRDDAVAIVLRALDSNNSELAYKMKRAIDKENAREARKSFN
ncbi:MAG: hypothetical protein WA005_01530, partial [Candidatus Binataceae bacterium]